MVTRIFKVYGRKGHRQRESFNKSYILNLSKGNDIRIIEVQNSDKTGTNDYSLVKVTRNIYEDCYSEILGQVSDGIFENSNVGIIEEVRDISKFRSMDCDDCQCNICLGSCMACSECYRSEYAEQYWFDFYYPYDPAASNCHEF